MIRRPPATPEALARTRPLVSAALHRAEERLPGPIRRIVAYHLGWIDPDGQEVENDGGKAVRPAITVLSAEAVGASFEAALTGAVSLELVHNFSLIHDDVMDGDRERRHRPTVWALFGVGEAIIAGDALMTLAQQLLAEDARPQARTAAVELARATAEMILGQSEDLAFESRLDVTEGECLAMCEHKTGALLAAAGALGAILGDGDGRSIDRLRSFGRHVGLAFQAVDDVLGIWGDPIVTGKPAASDLRQRKKTIPVTHAVATGGPAGQELIGLLSNGELAGDRLNRAVTLLEECGSRLWTQQLADRHLDMALAELDGGGFAAGPTNDLREIAQFVVRRDF
jgi:geranylgeranyl diphosphate synthase type I